MPVVQTFTHFLKDRSFADHIQATLMLELAILTVTFVILETLLLM